MTDDDLSRMLAQEPEIGAYGPRQVQPTKLATVSQILMRVLLALVLLIGGWLGIRDVSELRALKTSGQVVQGEVTNKRQTKGKSNSYYLDYRYSLSGITLEDSQKVSEETYNSTRYTDKVTVTALPRDPEIHRYGTVDEERESGAKANWFAGTVILGLIVEGLAYVIRKSTRDQTGALRDFIATQAVVTTIGKSTGGKVPTCPITFVYRSPFAGVVTRTESIAEQSLPKFPLNQPFTILIEPQSGERTMMLPILSMAEMAK